MFTNLAIGPHIVIFDIYLIFLLILSKWDLQLSIIVKWDSLTQYITSLAMIIMILTMGLFYGTFPWNDDILWDNQWCFFS